MGTPSPIQGILKGKHSAWEFFIRHYRLTYILLGGIILLGSISITGMPKESSPEVDIPVIVVSTIFPGASAEDVESLVTDPLEDKIQSISDIDILSSVSRPGISLITIQFDVDVPSADALTDVREKVDAAKPELPDDSNDPDVQKISFSDVPIVSYAVSGPYTPAQLDIYVQELSDSIESISGVSKVSVVGAPEREVRVMVDQTKLRQFGISIGAVTQAIHQANTELPIGSIETGDAVHVVRLDGAIENVAEINKIPIAVNNTASILVEDVARVIDGSVETGSSARLSVGGLPSTPSITLQVFKVSGGNVLNLVDEIDNRVQMLQQDLFPDDISIEEVLNNAKQIRTDLSNLLANGVETIIIITILLFIFLGWREALLASLAVPLTFLITFIFLAQLGYTLNFLTLFSLILALGILVDGAIVVIESMHSYMQDGVSSTDAAISTIREFKVPLISGTATTIFVFLPMMLTSGIIGKFIKSIPVTVSIVLLSSIFVALGIITTLGAHTLKVGDKKKEEGKRIKKFISYTYSAYSDSLWRYLTHAKKRVVFFLLIIALFFVSLTLPIAGLVQVEMFPADDLDQFSIDVENPIGTPLRVTEGDMEKIELVLQKDERITSFAINGGRSSVAGSVSGGFDTHLGSITVNLSDTRDQTSNAFVSEYQEKLQSVLPGKVTVTQQASGPEQGAPVTIRVSGTEFETLDSIAGQLVDMLEGIDGTRSVAMSTKSSNSELVVSIDRLKAQTYGVRAADVSALLRGAVTGQTATTIKPSNEDVDVVVRYDLDQRSDGLQHITQTELSKLQSLLVSTPQGDIPLTAFTSDTLGQSRAKIDHQDAERIVVVTSYVDDGYQSQSIINQVQERLDEIDLPSGYEVSFGGEAEDIQQSFTDMFIAMILGIFMIAGLLVWQFRSYRQPLFVLVTIPLALIGVFPGLALVGQPLSFPAFIGVVALSGIVVNNAIILIDRINENRISSGMDKLTAVHEAARSRLQPILLTTITTVSGILPLAITNPSWGPLGYSIVFGLLFSTLLTLFVVPLLYNRFGEDNLDSL